MRLIPKGKPRSLLVDAQLAPREERFAVTYLRFSPTEVWKCEPPDCHDPMRPASSSARFEVLGPDGRVTTTYGVWPRRALDQIMYATESPPLDATASAIEGRVDVLPDDRELRLFANDAMLYAVERHDRPLRARVVLLTEPARALAVQVDPSEHDIGSATVSMRGPLTLYLDVAVPVPRRSKRGCWSLLTVGDGPYVDPLSVVISDPFRSTGFYLPPQDGVPERQLDGQEPTLVAEELIERSRATEPGPDGGVTTRAKLAGQDLHRHRFARSDLKAADLSGADLRKTVIYDVKARAASFHRARMQKAWVNASDLSDADLRDADLSFAHVEGTNLDGADLRGAKLEGTRLRRSTFRSADLRDTRGLTQAQLDDACGDMLTQLPPGLQLTRCR